MFPIYCYFTVPSGKVDCRHIIIETRESLPTLSLDPRELFFPMIIIKVLDKLDSATIIGQICNYRQIKEIKGVKTTVRPGAGSLLYILIFLEK